ncbi:unnamed protein product [Rotaria socialis]|uniref:D-glucuronyl C5-epimerase C-terminal domain-containing protein n=1 Tax=Rotaria socialis TaxID=392032 RepID=A0A821M1E5_9BILA|nr:unnamed protein product [Rotaria socialis]CAF3294874.1 unnamed protein product [Rotaria socialis]CAF3637612.1 unnamed protein product [Rotaria socialis]CAF4158775.1 unnamed protein product [Rotaria socialis]CAF4179497.1 unnamed protein product [Rotaria socialis]
MRCRVRRLIFFLLAIVSLVILYQLIGKGPQTINDQSPFIIIHAKNHTYRILSSNFKYNSRESYLNFAYFNVEQRSRVLHIDYFYDIPVSSQWQLNGHLYPIQIAQFGLSHWSRLKLNTKIKQNHVYRFERIKPNKDNYCSSWNMIKNRIDLSNTFIHFAISSNCSLHIQFLDNDIELIYSTRKINDSKTSRKIIIPLTGFPRQVNRYMKIDIRKSIDNLFLSKSDFIKIRICGEPNSFVNELIVGNQTLYNQQAFYSVTRWLLHSQDLKTGCWFIHVKRTYGNHHQYRIRVPWCSAMAQGQAASLLVRLYSLTNDIQHLSAVRRAIQPLWSSNITRAYFNNRYLWLEEYPLESPAEGLFVLNGCLYALLGVIDVHTIDPQSYLLELINEMANSLHHMLPYYIHPKVSNWSLYDLSHITLQSKRNSATYSYHLVHIILLQCLSQIFRETNFSTSQLFDSYVQRFLSAISSKTNID